MFVKLIHKLILKMRYSKIPKNMIKEEGRKKKGGGWRYDLCSHLHKPQRAIDHSWNSLQYIDRRGQNSKKVNPPGRAARPCPPVTKSLIIMDKHSEKENFKKRPFWCLFQPFLRFLADTPQVAFFGAFLDDFLTFFLFFLVFF